MFIGFNYFKAAKHLFYMYYVFAHLTSESLLSINEPQK